MQSGRAHNPRGTSTPNAAIGKARRNAVATFVLVHGACWGGWSWRRLTPLLRTSGHDVWAPTLTGLGERVHLAHPAIDLATHITDIVNLLLFEDLTSVSLAGHSYGGMVIAGVAERVPERLAQLIFLDAEVPEDGQSEWDCAGGEADHRAAAVAAGTPDFWPVPVDYFRQRFPDRNDLEWVLAGSTPHPLATFAQPVRLGNPAAAALPRAFVYCTEGKRPEYASARFAARYRSAPGWRYREIAADHLAPLTAPHALAGALLSLVTPGGPSAT